MEEPFDTLCRSILDSEIADDRDLRRSKLGKVNKCTIEQPSDGITPSRKRKMSGNGSYRKKPYVHSTGVNGIVTVSHTANSGRSSGSSCCKTSVMSTGAPARSFSQELLDAVNAVPEVPPLWSLLQASITATADEVLAELHEEEQDDLIKDINRNDTNFDTSSG